MVKVATNIYIFLSLLEINAGALLLAEKSTSASDVLLLRLEVRVRWMFGVLYNICPTSLNCTRLCTEHTNRSTFHRIQVVILGPLMPVLPFKQKVIHALHLSKGNNIGVAVAHHKTVTGSCVRMIFRGANN